MINLVGSSLELEPMLQGIVDLTTEATDCHACFLYMLEDETLTIRAASPVYAAAVGNVQMRLDEGLTGGSRASACPSSSARTRWRTRG